MKNNPMNNYATLMADYTMTRTPTAVDAILVFNELSRDHYQDAIATESYRIKKRVIVKKDPSLNYVQFNDTESLLEDVKNLPWTVSMTVTGMEDAVGRLVRADDQILIDGILYTISMVEPSNRYLDGIVNCTVYPERSVQNDPLAIHRIDVVAKTGALDIIWGGIPKYYSFDGTTWTAFASYIAPASGATVLYLKDENGNIVSKTFGS